jgi:hypothetical protein
VHLRFNFNITFQAIVAGSGNQENNLSQFDGAMRGLGPTNSGESPHMLHYAHELARRDVEISNLRKAKHQLESRFRELQRAATTEDEKYQEKISQLKEEVERLVTVKLQFSTPCHLSLNSPGRTVQNPSYPARPPRLGTSRKTKKHISQQTTKQPQPTPPKLQQMPELSPIFMPYLAALLTTIIVVVVSCHRPFLPGNQRCPPPLTLRFTLQYFLYCV